MRTGWIRSAANVMEAAPDGLYAEAVLHEAFVELQLNLAAKELRESRGNRISLDQATGILRFRKATKPAEPAFAPGVGGIGSTEDALCMVQAIQEVSELAKQGVITMDEFHGLMN